MVSFTNRTAPFWNTIILLSKRTKPWLDDLDVRLCICGHLKPRPRQAEHVRRRWRPLCEHHGVLSPPIVVQRSHPSGSPPFFVPSFTRGRETEHRQQKIFQDGLISLPTEIPAQHLCRCDQTSIEGQLCRLTPGLVCLKSSDTWLLFNCNLNLPFWPGSCIILQNAAYIPITVSNHTGDYYRSWKVDNYETGR